MHDEILKARQVARLLDCSLDTLAELTPNTIKGAKFGRSWVYLRSHVLEAVAAQADKRQPRPTAPSVDQPVPRQARNKRRVHPDLRAVK
jgi:hypothetical protein